MESNTISCGIGTLVNSVSNGLELLVQLIAKHLPVFSFCTRLLLMPKNGVYVNVKNGNERWANEDVVYYELFPNVYHELFPENVI